MPRRVIDLFRKFRPPDHAAHDLTPHETRLLQLLVWGHNYKSAAAEPGVSVDTLAFHSSIYARNWHERAPRTVAPGRFVLAGQPVHTGSPWT